MTPLPPPVTDASAWYGRDMAADPSWAVPFTPAMREEVLRAAAAMRARGLQAPDFTRADFPLPLTGPLLAGAMEQVLRGRGFALLRGLPVAGQDEATAKAMYWGIGLHLGTPVTQNRAGDLVATITDLGLDVSQLNVKPSLTNAEQRPHTDPGDVVALLCVHGAKSGGVSRIASTTTIYNEISAHHPEYLEVLHRGFHHDLRGDASDAAPFGCTPRPVPVYRRCGGVLSCVFNASTIKDAQRRMGTAIPATEMAAVDRVVELARSDALRLDMEFQPGDVQLLNNYTTVHWRTAFTDHPEPERRRRLLRLWLSVEAARPLDPAMTSGNIMGAVVGRQAPPPEAVPAHA